MTLEELTCIQECKDLITRYFILLDNGPRAEMVDLYTEDGEMGSAVGTAALRELFAGVPANFFPIHPVMNIMVKPTGPDTAEGTAYIVAYNLFGDPNDKLPRKMPPTPSRIGKGSYEFRKTPAGWRIVKSGGGGRFVDDGLT